MLVQDMHKALHKCNSAETNDNERPVGFCSSITVGSQLPFKVPIMKGSTIELLARRGRLEILVQNPPDGQELYWQNTRTVPKPYKGPKEIRLEQDFSPDHDVKLALTCWAYGAFDVMHPEPGSAAARRMTRSPSLPLAVSAGSAVVAAGAVKNDLVVSGKGGRHGRVSIAPHSPASDASSMTA
eukprot:jgi/Chrzof1/984/Cz01g35220.t1